MEKPRGPRSPLWREEGARFGAVLADRKIGKTAFGITLGRPFHTIHRWTKGFEFGPERQQEAAHALDLPSDAFVVPLAGQGRERHTRAVLARFRATRPLAASLDEAQWQVLRSIRFDEESLRPTVAFYETVAAALMGAIRVDEIVDVATENAALDDALAHKPPLRRRPT